MSSAPDVSAAPVRAWFEDVVLPTFLPRAPDPNPMFLEQRVYQGSSGKVYPLPFTDRVAETKTDRAWRMAMIENEFLRVEVLPALGGRVHAILDKTNGYDIIYRQNAIKPALVGLAGPWISGGIEFNWPQHHRPATFLSVECEIAEDADGARTLWCADHDPLSRLRGVHGIRLRPGLAVVELLVRAHNRTPFAQSFLWWANVAARVHEGYQSFFPPDVHYVADHAKRAMSAFPRCRGDYYGINYAARARRGVPQAERPAQFVPPHLGGDTSLPNYSPDDLSWYANIPTPCSYMAMGSKENFFGGYDHRAKAGFVHVADRHISPGKKQWTWGNHEFGYAWDRNLTEPDARGEYGPYIELMAGVFTDNQPDFSFLQPGETKAWSQFWYPIQHIGPAHHANLDAAASLVVSPEKIRVGVGVTRALPGAKIRLETRASKRAPMEWSADLAPGKPFVIEVAQPRVKLAARDCVLRVLADDGREIISHAPKPPSKGSVPPPATEPPPPAEIASADELFVTGLHLEQYRHATRCPTLYWHEALRRDSDDARCNNALGRWHLLRGEFALAEAHFRRAIARLTHRNPNPADCEPYYHLGLCLRHQLDAAPTPDWEKFDEAYSAFYKATWNQAWAGASFHALAEMDCRRADWTAALDHLDRALRLDSENPRARNLRAIVLRQLGRDAEATEFLRTTLALDPLDPWTRHLLGVPAGCDAQTCLDVAHDCAHAGFFAEAASLLNDDALAACSRAHSDLPTQSWGAAPLMHYTLGWLQEKMGQHVEARRLYGKAAAESPDYCFPARLEEIAVLESAMRANPRNARAPAYLGHLLYDRRRHVEAIKLWERAARLDPGYSVVWRNLGIGYFNVLKQPKKARAAYDRALRANPRDARLLYERDQLWKRLRKSPKKRLRELEAHLELVRQRDDLSVEYAALLNQNGSPERARDVLVARKFQPWEGGEGLALAQHTRAHLALGRRALAAGDAAAARELFTAALGAPENLGEARHVLANQSDALYWLGEACHALGDPTAARAAWRAAAEFRGDFQEMRVRAHSEMTYFSALTLARLGRRAESRRLLRALFAHARQLRKSRAQIEYFATSLPAMLLFHDDIQARQTTTAIFLEAQARLGLGDASRARALLRAVLRRDPAHAPATDLLAELN